MTNTYVCIMKSEHTIRCLEVVVLSWMTLLVVVAKLPPNDHNLPSLRKPSPWKHQPGSEIVADSHWFPRHRSARHHKHVFNHLDEHSLHRPVAVAVDGCHGNEEANKMLLRKCYSSLKKVLIGYSKLLKEEENDTKVMNYDLCGNLQDVFSNCSVLLNSDVTKECLSRDKSMKMKLDTSCILLEHFENICSNKDTHQHEKSMEIQSCFREEYRGTLSIRCDEYYEFNVLQATRSDCFFLRERFKCQESLLDSSCGPQSSLINFHFLLTVFDKELSKHNCSILRNDPTYNAFEYDDKGCKRGIIRMMEWCTSTHLDGSFILNFHPDNDLVAMGKPGKVTKLCRAYGRFKKCIGPMREFCPNVVSLFLEYESKLHQYMLKMDFICRQQVIRVYSSNLKCLRSTATKQRLCEVHWSHLNVHLHNISSVQFFCLPHEDGVVKVTSELSHLHSCHKEVFTKECGSEVGLMVMEFLQLALSNPLYLRFGYKPNCSLHGFKTHGSMEEEEMSIPFITTNPFSMHLHPHHPTDDENSDVFITSGIAEEDENEVIVTSSPSLTEVYTPNDFFEFQGHTVEEDHATILIDSQSVGFLDNVEASTGKNTLETDGNRFEKMYFPVETNSSPALEGRNISYPVSIGTPGSTCDICFLSHLTSVTMLLLWM